MKRNIKITLAVTVSTIILFSSILSFYWVNVGCRFTYEYYDKFCDTISDKQYSVFTVSSFIHAFRNNTLDFQNTTPVILRHDIDERNGIQNAKHLAEIEKKHNLRSTYYIRMHAEDYSVKDAEPLMKWLHSNGFEIGYHYECFYLAKGNNTRAHEIFANDINELRKIVPITTICSHGNSKEYINWKMWNKQVEYEKYNVTSAYLDVLYNTTLSKYIKYWSDAGGIPNVKTQLIEYVKETDEKAVYVLAHPEGGNRSLSSMCASINTQITRGGWDGSILWEIIIIPIPVSSCLTIISWSLIIGKRMHNYKKNRRKT